MKYLLFSLFFFFSLNSISGEHHGHEHEEVHNHDIKPRPVPNLKEAVIDWEILKGIDGTTEALSDNLKKIVNTKVKLLGYMTPLDFEKGHVKEFMLLPDQMACAHSNPPHQNQVIHVKVNKKHKIKNSWDPIYVTGILKIAAKKPGIPEAPIFEMESIIVKKYEPKDGSIPVKK